MTRYSFERKVAVLDKMLPPHNLTITEVSTQEGISESCLYNWRKQAKEEERPVPGSRKPTPEGTPMYVTHPYWLAELPGMYPLIPSEGQAHYVQSGGRVFAQLITRGGTASFQAETQFIAECWGRGSTPKDIFQLIGTHTSNLAYPRNVIATATLYYLLPLGCTPPK